MKIIFNNSFYEFHKDFIKCIKLEIEKRNGILIITDCCENTSLTAKQIENIYIELHSDANFTILPDEACRVIGGIGIYINHAIPVVPQNKFYYSLNFKRQIHKNADYLFLSSKLVANLYTSEFKIKKNIIIVGLPKLDEVFIKRKNKVFNSNNPTIIYAPTGNWKKHMNSEKIVNLNLLKKYGMIHKIGHPASDNNNKSSLTYLSEADIIISDYSSIGLESIILNIPTILIDDNYWDNQVKNIDLVCENARNATIRVTNIDELIIAIVKYKSDPKYLENERIKYGKQLSTFHFNASEIFVNELYKIYSSNHF